MKRGGAPSFENPWQLSSFTQTVNGNVLFCGGFGFVGPTRKADPVTIATMMRNIAEIIPSFSSLRILRGWAGLEPCTPSNLPAIGFAPDLSNFVLAAGHGNAGVMMSPFTGQMVSDAIFQSAHSGVGTRRCAYINNGDLMHSPFQKLPEADSEVDVRPQDKLTDGDISRRKQVLWHIAGVEGC